MENTDTLQKDNVVELKASPEAAQPEVKEAPKELTEKEKADQQIIQKATQDYADLKFGVQNLVNVHELLNQGTFPGYMHMKLNQANAFITNMFNPLRKQLDDHPMFKAEQAEEMKKKDDALVQHMAKVKAQAKEEANGEAPAVN